MLRNLSRLLIVFLAVGLLVAAPVAASSTRPTGPAAIDQTATTLSTAKVAIIVGPTEGTTANYKSAADAAYGVAIQYTPNVVKAYSPAATWTAVQTAVAGASIVIYLGHGNGWPSPYTWDPTYATKDGFGLNDPANLSDSVHKYYGEPSVSTLQFAPNAVVLLNHLCYASGNSEPNNPAPTLSVAEQRVDNYGAGFLRGGAQAVIAEGHGSLGPLITALFTAHESVYDAWRTMPNANGNTFTFGSSRTAGATAAMDPDVPGSGFYRSFVGNPSVTTDSVIASDAAHVASASAPSTYVALSPARLLDSRVGNGLSGAFTPNAPRAFQVTGRGGVPADAIAVTGNLTGTKATAGGYVSLTPDPDPNPTTSTINFPAGDTRANGVTVTLGAGGTLAAVYKGTGSVQLIFDVTGYYR